MVRTVIQVLLARRRQRRSLDRPPHARETDESPPVVLLPAFPGRAPGAAPA